MILSRLTQAVLMQQAAPEGAAEAAGPLAGMANVLPLVLILLVLYTVVVRPSNKQRKQQQQLLATLKKDDEVVTQSGMLGRIASLDEQVATLEVAERVKVRILRDRIAGRWPPVAAGATVVPASKPQAPGAAARK